MRGKPTCARAAAAREDRPSEQPAPDGFQASIAPRSCLARRFCQNATLMSKALPARPRVPAKAKSAFALVVSRYNSEYTSALEQNAHEELLAIDPNATVEVFDAPGSFEIPLIVKLLAERRQYHAILALGIILKGETAHADLIAASITNSLQQIALSHGVPVIHEVLLLNNEDQARARCLEPELNRGREAARAAAAVAHAVREIITG